MLGPMVLHAMGPADAGALAHLLAWLPFVSAAPAAWLLYWCSRRGTLRSRTASRWSHRRFDDEPV